MIQKSKSFLNEKNIKITKRANCNVEILNSFNPELQLKDTESEIKSKLIDLLTQSKSFKFVTTLFLVFKKIEGKDKTKYDTFYSHSKAKIIINGSNIVGVFKSILHQS